MNFKKHTNVMRKILLTAALLLLVLIASHAAEAPSSSEAEYRRVEQAFASATDMYALSGDAAFISKVKEVISRGDDFSARIVADHGTFVFMNGMLNDVGKAISKMSEETKNTDEGKKAIELYNSLRIMDKGSQVPDFTLPAPDGSAVNLYSYVKDKKCVLVDFWASWCGWCRKENPFVRAAYDAYKDKGFDIISVSIDEKDDAWRKALAEDKPSWTQVVDNRATKGGVYQWYGLNGIPAIFLIDNQGRIIAKDLRGTAISTNVKKYLGL